MNIPDKFGLRRSGQPKQESALPMPAVVRPRRLTNGVADDRPEANALAAVEQALAQDPRPMPNSADAVVQSFVDMGRSIAAAMRKAGDLAAEQGERRKQEYYRAAEVAERKAEFQAREAGEFIDSLASINGAMAPKPVVVAAETVAALPPAADRTAGDAGTVLVAPTESPEGPEPPKAA